MISIPVAAAAAKPARKSLPKRPKPSQQPAKANNNNSNANAGKKPRPNQAMPKMNNMFGNNNNGMSVDEQKQCLSILSSLQRHKSAGPFLRPVDPIKLGIPDYFSVIRDPMDLSTIDHNLRINFYHSTTQFAADIRKIWNNSYLYNQRDSQIYNMTLEMDKYFEKKFKEMESNVFGDSSNIPYYVKILAQAINGNTNAVSNGSAMHIAGGNSNHSAKSRPQK